MRADPPGPGLSPEVSRSWPGPSWRQSTSPRTHVSRPGRKSQPMGASQPAVVPTPRRGDSSAPPRRSSTARGRPGSRGGGRAADRRPLGLATRKMATFQRTVTIPGHVPQRTYHSRSQRRECRLARRGAPGSARASFPLDSCAASLVIPTDRPRRGCGQRKQPDRPGRPASTVGLTGHENIENYRHPARSPPTPRYNADDVIDFAELSAVPRRCQVRRQPTQRLWRLPDCRGFLRSRPAPSPIPRLDDAAAVGEAIGSQQKCVERLSHGAG